MVVVQQASGGAITPRTLLHQVGALVVDALDAFLTRLRDTPGSEVIALSDLGLMVYGLGFRDWEQ